MNTNLKKDNSRFKKAEEDVKIINVQFNPRLTGGAFDAPPPSRIFAIVQKRTALSTWNFADLLIQQFDIVREFFFEIRRNFF